MFFGGNKDYMMVYGNFNVYVLFLQDVVVVVVSPRLLLLLASIPASLPPFYNTVPIIGNAKNKLKRII